MADIVALRRKTDRTGKTRPAELAELVAAISSVGSISVGTATIAGTTAAPVGNVAVTPVRSTEGPTGKTDRLGGPDRLGMPDRLDEHDRLGAGLERLLPVLPELRPLLPGGGLRRGATVVIGDRLAGTDDGRAAHNARRAADVPGSVAGDAGPATRHPWAAGPAPGATSLVLALLAGVSRAGSWCAVVGVPTLGVLAAAEIGVDLGRLALVPEPGPDWPAVVAALLDGVDVVVAAPPAGVSSTVARRLAARARRHGSVLVSYGQRWEGADLVLEPVRGTWRGLGQGRGRLRTRELVISARGRGSAARLRQVRVWLPGGDLADSASRLADRPIEPIEPIEPIVLEATG